MSDAKMYKIPDGVIAACNNEPQATARRICMNPAFGEPYGGRPAVSQGPSASPGITMPSTQTVRHSCKRPADAVGVNSQMLADILAWGERQP